MRAVRPYSPSPSSITAREAPRGRLLNRRVFLATPIGLVPCLIPTLPPFPIPKRSSLATEESHVTTNTQDGDADVNAPKSPISPTDPDEQRRIMQLEKTLRTRALIDDMINTLE